MLGKVFTKHTSLIMRACRRLSGNSGFTENNFSSAHCSVGMLLTTSSSASRKISSHSAHRSVGDAVGNPTPLTWFTSQSRIFEFVASQSSVDSRVECAAFLLSVTDINPDSAGIGIVTRCHAAVVRHEIGRRRRRRRRRHQ
jgi:hypothetical protein